MGVNLLLSADQVKRGLMADYLRQELRNHTVSMGFAQVLKTILLRQNHLKKDLCIHMKQEYC